MQRTMKLWTIPDHDRVILEKYFKPGEVWRIAKPHLIDDPAIATACRSRKKSGVSIAAVARQLKNGLSLTQHLKSIERMIARFERESYSTSRTSSDKASTDPPPNRRELDRFPARYGADTGSISGAELGSARSSRRSP